MRIKISFIVLIILLVFKKSYSQLEIMKTNVSDFSTFKSIEQFTITNNSSLEQNCSLTISIKLLNGESVLEIIYPELKLLPGTIDASNIASKRKILIPNTISGKYLKLP